MRTITYFKFVCQESLLRSGLLNVPHFFVLSSFVAWFLEISRICFITSWNCCCEENLLGGEAQVGRIGTFIISNYLIYWLKFWVKVLHLILTPPHPNPLFECAVFELRKNCQVIQSQVCNSLVFFPYYALLLQTNTILYYVEGGVKGGGC